MRTPPRRLVFSVLDQGVSSLSNVLLSVAVARVAPPAVYAHFLLGLTIVVAILTVTRQSVGAYLVAQGGSADAERGERVGCALLLQYSMAPLAAVGPCVLLVGPGELGSRAVLFALAVAGPVAVAQDGLRYLAVSRGRAGVALASDVLWLAFFLLAWPLVTRFGAAPFLLTVAWGAGALVGFLVLAKAVGARPRVRGWRRWWTDSQGTVVRLLGDGVISAATPIGVVALIGVLLPLVQSGAYLAATVLFGPVNVLITLFAFVLSAELERVRERRRAVLTFLAVGLSTGAAIALYTCATLLLPASWGQALLGATWATAQPILGFRGAEAAAMGMLTVLYAYWRWCRHYASQLWSRVLLAAATVLAVGLACLWFASGRAVAASSAVAVLVVLLGSVGYALATDGRSSASGRPRGGDRAGQQLIARRTWEGR